MNDLRRTTGSDYPGAWPHDFRPAPPVPATDGLRAVLERLRPITPTYHAVVAGVHLDSCIACLIVTELDAALDLGDDQ